METKSFETDGFFHIFKKKKRERKMAVLNVKVPVKSIRQRRVNTTHGLFQGLSGFALPDEPCSDDESISMSQSASEETIKVQIFVEPAKKIPNKIKRIFVNHLYATRPVQRLDLEMKGLAESDALNLAEFIAVRSFNISLQRS